MTRRILLVDDHPMVLTSLTQTLQEEGYQVIAAENILQAVEKLDASETPFDLLLLDYNLAGEKGDDLFDQHAFQHPKIVVIISGMTDPNTIYTALKRCSAQAFISKNISLANLPLALSAIDEKWTTPRIWSDKQRRFISITDIIPKEQLLTTREREVYELLHQGMSDKQIARRLSRSIHTVRVHVRSVKRKTAVGRRKV